MNKSRYLSIAAGLSVWLGQGAHAAEISVDSPNKILTVKFKIEAGIPMYEVHRGDDIVIEPSRLGVRLKKGPNLASNLQVESHDSKLVDRKWEQVWGEERIIRDRHRELVVNLTNVDGPPAKIEYNFRVFDDGIGFRYQIPKQPELEAIEILDEASQFAMSGDHRAWWIPAYRENRYEYHYNDSPLSSIGTAHTPATFQASDKLFVSIHEAALTDFASMTLKYTGDNTLEADLVPWSDGVKVRGNAPMISPWRTIQFAETPGGLVESNLILNLNEPNKLDDVSWIKPGKYVGIWWEMHLEKSTWSSGPKHGATTENTKLYIDFAAKHGFDGVLVEGWNEGWDGNWLDNGDLFSFTKSYPDFDINELSKYASEHGVRLIGHHETGGGVENYERQMEDAFALYERLGVRAVKTGYVKHGQNIIRTDESGKKHNEWHHGQYMVRHYRKVIEAAAKHKIMLDVHEPIKDTGIRRTYPNMMTREGACGQEFNAWGFDNRNPPDHTVILPFTRLLAGPMDFTPGIFDVLFKDYREDNRVSTTLTKQLALYVVLYSPLHMAADLPENYEARPEPFEFIKDVPTDWSHTRVLNAEIGDFVTIARKDRNSDDWYIGAITDENKRDMTIPFDFLDASRAYVAEIYRDGEKGDWKDNPYDYVIESREVNAKTQMQLYLAPGGGAAIRIRPKN